MIWANRKDRPAMIRSALSAVIWGIVVGGTVASETPTLHRYEKTGIEMAVPIRLIFYARDEKTATRAGRAAMAEISRLNPVFSEFDPQSEARRLCAHAKPGTATPVGKDLFRVLSAANEVSIQSGGAFDITVGPLTRLWRRTIRREQLPSKKRLDEARRRIGFEAVVLDPEKRTVTLQKPDMRLDFGGIAKGYAIDAALKVLRKHKITRALVELGGDIGVGDPPPERPGWRIGIARLEDDAPPSEFVVLSNAAVATSGDTWQYVEIAGHRYSHIVDPRTGMGLTDHSSVTVIAPTAMRADALASAVSVLGPTEGIKLIEKTPVAATLIVQSSCKGPKKTGKKTFRSSRLKHFTAPER